jgi:hypothetical protein
MVRDVRPDVGDGTRRRRPTAHSAGHLRCWRGPLSHHRRWPRFGRAQNREGSGSRPRCSKPRSLGVYEAANYFANGIRPPSSALSAPRPTRFQTSDGWLTIGGARLFQLCAMIGKSNCDPRFKTNAERVKNNDLIVGLLQTVASAAPPTG